ncbi:sugar phosphate isomerase/epimerase [Cyclobacteriaceae bacterium YHN15]|nr:sugar phosphate isomerase/epimerase [Cyclobacteriaceae bacterium YHN15]
MKLSISNIAWDVAEDEKIAELLAFYGVKFIDIAPGKYFWDFENATTSSILAIKNWWGDRGIQVIGMQSLLFGKPDLNVFGTKEIQDRLLDHLSHVCRIGGELGAIKLVFGSPKNRDRSAIKDADVNTIAYDFFGRLGEIAQKEGVIVCLEPNPTLYGANFLTNTQDTADFVAALAHPGIKMQLDTGAITINSEEFSPILEKHKNLVGHIHISEPNLLPIGEGSTDHLLMSKLIRQHLPDEICTIEMVGKKGQSNYSVIDKVIKKVIGDYR